jgi:hypothetical protein
VTTGRGGIRRGYSLSRDTAEAARELHERIAQPDIGLAVFFCSAGYDLDKLAAEIDRRFAGVEIIGCTTAGEITPVGYRDGAITGFSIAAADCSAVIARIDDLATFQISGGQVVADTLITRLAQRGQSAALQNSFAMLLIDGMSASQETVLSAIHGRMAAIPIFGGSAGDDLRLQRTHVYHQGHFHADAALLTLVRTRRKVKIFQSQHFYGSETRMVVTQADPQRRTVGEINAEPAAQEYARIVGLDPAHLTPAMFAEHPVIVKVGPQSYVRSIQRANADGSLSFFCAIDEGVVLRLAYQEDIVAQLRALFHSIHREIGPPELVIGFDCVLRNLEVEKRQLRHVAGQIMADNNVVGFSSYGEQFAGMHANQTFTGIAIGSDLADDPGISDVAPASDVVTDPGPTDAPNTPADEPRRGDSA